MFNINITLTRRATNVDIILISISFLVEFIPDKEYIWKSDGNVVLAVIRSIAARSNVWDVTGAHCLRLGIRSM
jgi:hypothetical protein